MNYCLCLALLVFARGADLLSTWIVTPDLGRETNPIMKRIGWTATVHFNLWLCLALAFWLKGSVIVATASILAGARNLQFQARFPRFCILGHLALIGAIGGAVVLADGFRTEIGAGVCIFGFATFVHSVCRQPKMGNSAISNREAGGANRETAI